MTPRFETFEFAGFTLAPAALAPAPGLEMEYRRLGVPQGDGRGRRKMSLGGTPDEYPARYRTDSPREMLPLGVRQLILHVTADDAVPIELSRRYARAILCRRLLARAA